MTNYECILILSAKLDDQQVKDSVQTYSALLEKNSATIEQVELWGKRELAQAIKKQKHGHYINVLYSSDTSETNSALAQALRLDDTVLKFQTHKLGLPTKKFVPRKTVEKADDLI